MTDYERDRKEMKAVVDFGCTTNDYTDARMDALIERLNKLDPTVQVSVMKEIVSKTGNKILKTRAVSEWILDNRKLIADAFKVDSKPINKLMFENDSGDYGAEKTTVQEFTCVCNNCGSTNTKLTYYFRHYGAATGWVQEILLGCHDCDSHWHAPI